MCTYNLEYHLKRIVKFMYSNVYACVCKFVCVCSLWHLTLFYSDSKSLSKIETTEIFHFINVFHLLIKIIYI